MEVPTSEDSEVSDWQWLSMFYQSARDVGEVVVDDFATIKRRMIDKHEEELKKGCKANSWLVRNVVKNFVQSIKKSVENLGELQMDVIKALKIRYPNLEADWISENSVENSVSSSVKSPDSDLIKNGEQEDGKGESRVKEVNKRTADSEKSQLNVGTTQKQTRSAIQTRYTPQKSQNYDNDENLVIDSESGSEKEDGSTSKKDQNDDDQVEQTQSTVPTRPTTPPSGQTQDGDDISLDTVSESESEDGTTRETIKNNQKPVKTTQSTIPPKTTTPPFGKTQNGDKNVISDSGSEIENEIGLKEKSGNNLSHEQISPSTSPNKPIVSQNSNNSSILAANETVADPEDFPLSDPDQIIPASPASSQEIASPILHGNDDDSDAKSDATIPTENIKKKPVLDSDLEGNEDQNMQTPSKINITESKINLNDQAPSTSAPKSESVKAKRETMDKESMKAKKQVLFDSSDEEYFKPTPIKKPVKSSNEKSKEESKDLTKKKVKTKQSPRSKKYVTSSDDDTEKPTKLNEAKKIRKSKKKVDPDYWKKHNVKDDAKLQNLDETVVVLERLDEVMEKELENYGVVRIATLTESSESETPQKRITRALRNFDKFDPLVRPDENRKHSSKTGNRELRSRKCKGESKYNLDAVSGSEDDKSSDDSDRLAASNVPRIAKNIFSSDDSSTTDNLSSSSSETDSETAKKNVLDDSEEEAAESKTKKEKKGKSDKDSKEKKKNYYVPAVCRLSSSSDDDDKKPQSKNSKPKEAVKPKKFSEDDSSDEFIPPKKRTMRGKKKVSSETEEISSDDSDSSNSSSKKKTKGRDKRQKSSSSEEDKAKKKKRKRVQVLDSDDSDDKKQNNSDSDIQEVAFEKPESGSPSKGRKKIRKVMSKKELEESTREAEKEEEERKRRVLEKQKLVIFNSQSDAPTSDVLESLVLDVDPDSKETLVAADPSVVCKLKPHQAKGIKFIYDCTIESTKQIKEGNAGGGCIIAHCMGLGKTLTTITFVHAALTHKELNFKTVLIICPLNTVTNWYNELRSWLKDADESLHVHSLWEQKTNRDRADALARFMKRGGVGIIHYDLFRRLADMSGQKKISEKLKEQIRENLLDPGADIVVCDEGHLLKNDKSKLSIAVNKIKTRRRIVLTGTPLQNNLAEYHTMMSFVKPNLLGTMKEFQNRFINPIKNGQHADSQDHDVKLMKKRAHVLHKLLDGCVQRLDYSVLMPYLPPKHEYVVMVKITPKQAELYKHYLENLMSRTSVIDRHRSLLKNYAYLLKIWTHPIALTRVGRKKADGEEDSEGSLKDFIVDGSESNSKSSDSDTDTDWASLHNKKIQKKKAAEIEKKAAEKEKTAAVALDAMLDETPQELPFDWYLNFFESKEDMMDPLLGGKFEVLMEIIKICESVGDKLLVFSQYLSSLDLIEEFLQNWDTEGRENERKASISFPTNLGLSIGRWRKNIEYYRIDGSTKADVRQDQCDKFNSKHTTRAKLFLISTKAGGLGINLVGANRVVIFDASWNPSHDMQSIYRVYRFGQSKPCYIYRLLAQGTMEEKIYNRQVVKLSLSGRVVDEHQIERHFKFEETNSLYLYEDPDEMIDRPIPPVPKDRLLADLLISQKDRITTYLEHDSLLVNRVDEGLTDEERKAAWEEYHYEKQSRGQGPPGSNDSTFNKIWNILQQRHPLTPPEQIRQAADTILSKINELQLNLNYYNLHQHALTPDEEHYRKNVIEGLRLWIAQALGTNGANPPTPQPTNVNNIPRMPMQGTGVITYPPASTSRAQIVPTAAQQQNPEIRPPPNHNQIYQGMQDALSKVGGPKR